MSKSAATYPVKNPRNSETKKPKKLRYCKGLTFLLENKILIIILTQKGNTFLREKREHVNHNTQKVKKKMFLNSK